MILSYDTNKVSIFLFKSLPLLTFLNFKQVFHVFPCLIRVNIFLKFPNFLPLANQILICSVFLYMKLVIVQRFSVHLCACLLFSSTRILFFSVINRAKFLSLLYSTSCPISKFPIWNTQPRSSRSYNYYNSKASQYTDWPGHVQLLTHRKPSKPSSEPFIVSTGARAYAFATLRFLSRTITLAQISSSICVHLSSTSCM